MGFWVSKADKERRYKITIVILSALVVLEAAAVIVLSIRVARRPPVAVLPQRPKIAIVLDDWGHNPADLEILAGMKYPLTMAILPNLPYSAVVAGNLYRRGYEVILHLPMEPREKSRLEKNTITVELEEGAIKDILDKDLAGLNFAKGVSNHMGSLATCDAKTMSVIFKELKKRRLYFLDSFVTEDSLCKDLAAKIRLPFARRDIFLDNIDELRYIRSQIYKLKKKARKQGGAIGIGHDRRRTLETLKEALPQLEKEGYRLVFVSELVK